MSTGAEIRPRTSFLLWLMEVDAVLAELTRVARERGLSALGERLREELDAARVRAEARRYPGKALRFAPSADVAELLEAAVLAARARRRAEAGPGGDRGLGGSEAA